MKYFIYTLIVTLVLTAPCHATTEILKAATGDKAETSADNSNTSEKEAGPIIAPDLDGFFDSMTKQYEGFVDGMGFDSEFVSRLMATSVVLFVTFLLLWIVQKLGYGLKHRLNVIRDRNALYHDRFRYYARAIRYVGYFIVSLFALYTLFIVWGVTDMSTAIDEWGRALIGEVLSIFIIVLFALGIWEFLNTVMERYIQSLDSVNSSRLLTVLPIIKNVFFVAFVILFSLVILSQIGINIVPLLAGAGVLGIAIGFGAQTMVKDFLTGFTIILEDLIQVGDVATLAGKTGVIERITIRKVQMRDLAGTVYTIPFGEITIVENLTKEFSFFCTDIGVAYRENTDEVIEYIREVDEDLRSDEDFKDLITEPLEVLGVDAFADSAVMIKVRMKTRPIKQWAVGREFNRRIKLKFDEMGVEIPFPHQTIYFGEDKEGKAPAARVLMSEKEKNKKSKSPKKSSSKSAKNNAQDNAAEVGYEKDSKTAEIEDAKEKASK